MQNTFIESLSATTFSDLNPYGVTLENFKQFFTPSGGINKKTRPDINEIVKILMANNPPIPITLMRTMKKHPFIEYICTTLQNSISSQQVRITPVRHCNRDSMKTNVEVTKPKMSTFKRKQKLSETVTYIAEQNYPPSIDELKKHPFFLPTNSTLYSNLERYKKVKSRSPLPTRFYKTQPPQYLIEKILYAKPLMGLNKIKFKINNLLERNDQRIILRVFDTSIGSDDSDVYIEQLMINSKFVNIKEYYYPINKTPCTTPTIIRNPIDITNNLQSEMNDISLTLQTYKEDIIVVIALCSYCEQNVLIQNIKNGINKEFVHTMLNNTSECNSTVNSIIENNNNLDEDITIEKNIIPLRCSLSFSPIEIPVKGKNCSHSSIIDYKSLINYCCSNKCWNCPICQKECLYCDITIDMKLYNILKDVPKNCSNIEVVGEDIKFIMDDEQSDESDVIEI